VIHRGREAFPVVLSGVNSGLPPFRDHNAGASGWEGKRPRGVSGVEDQGLVIGHFGQVLHRNEVFGTSF
jgi:hypothetical protein